MLLSKREKLKTNQIIPLCPTERLNAFNMDDAFIVRGLYDTVCTVQQTIFSCCFLHFTDFLSPWLCVFAHCE